MHSGVTSDLQKFNNELAAKLQAPVFPSFGNYSKICAEGYMLSHAQEISEWLQNDWQCPKLTFSNSVTRRLSTFSPVTLLWMQRTFNGSLTRRVLAGRYAQEIARVLIFWLYLQRWIGSDAASQVDHKSGSYSIVVPGMNLRYYHKTLSFILNLPFPRIISVNTQYWYKVK